MGHGLGRSMVGALVLAAGLAVGISETFADSYAARVPAQATQRGAADARAETELPIRRVTLYASGVGSFQHFGRVTGTETISMRFKTDQINDILKSMVLLDLDGGDIGAVTYASQEPLERRLASFGIDISKISNTVDLLTQLRGTPVRLGTPDGEFEGAVLSVEDRTTLVTATQGGNHAHYQEPYVTIVTESGLRSFAISNIRTLEITDERLRGELSRALLALAEHRADRSKSVEVTFSGSPNVARRVVASYVSEMPVWKSSYRLVLPDEKAGGRPTLQAWAIVENTTDHDWEDVELALASGRPVSFVMNLYQTLFAPRPEVPVPMIFAVAPRIYEAAMNRQSFSSGFTVRSESARAGRSGAALDAPREEPFSSQSQGQDSLLYALSAEELSDYSAKAQAAAGVVGEQFLFTVNQPVTLARQQSAMLPIANSAISGERVSVFTPTDGQPHPMRGMRITNDAGIPLMPGPIAVYDGAVYAGDAQIPHTSRGMDRLLTYAVDLDVRIDTEISSTRNVQRFRIINGLLETYWLQDMTTTYTLANSAENERRIFIEHPRRHDWEIVSQTKPTEVTESINRFEVKVSGGENERLVVKEETVNASSVRLIDVDFSDGFGEYIRDGRMSEEIAAALSQIRTMRTEIASLENAVRDLDRERDDISNDQSRVRENMTRLDRTSDLYQRYVRQMNLQEDRLEKIHTERAALSERLQEARDALNRYIASLKIG